MVERHHVDAGASTDAPTIPVIGSVPTVTTAVSLDDVAKRFGSRHVIDDVRLDVADSEIVTLLGPSGCGKTTLLRLIAGLETPTSGVVTVGGGSAVDARRKKAIGFVPQSPALLPWRSVAANARLLLEVNRRSNPADHPDPMDLLVEVGLGEFSGALPHELSGGMRQRVALVRAFALAAPILLLDEPFAALDEITREDMRHLLARLCERSPATIVFVTHSIPEAVFLSDRVAVMSPRPGRIVDVIDIELERPRTPEIEDDPAFFELERLVRHTLHAGLQR